jgi:hypothetical protein
LPQHCGGRGGAADAPGKLFLFQPM